MKPTDKQPVSRAKGDGSKYNGVTLPKDATQRRRLRNKLSAQVHRKRKQDAINTGQGEIEACDTEIDRLRTKLSETRSTASSLQAIMDAIQLEFGSEAVSHIFEKCNQPQVGMTTPAPRPRSVSTTAKSVTSESDAHVSSSSDDESSLGFFQEDQPQLASM